MQSGKTCGYKDDDDDNNTSLDYSDLHVYGGGLTME